MKKDLLTPRNMIIGGVCLTVLSIAFWVILAISFISFFNAHPGSQLSSTINSAISVNKESVEIKAPETASLKYTETSNDVFSMTIPEGWKVETMGSYIKYGIRVYDPNDSRYQIFAFLKMEPFLKSSAAANNYKSMSGLASGLYRDSYLSFANAVVLNPVSTKSFYNNFEDNVYYMESSYGNMYYGDISSFTFPELYNFSVIEEYDYQSPLGQAGVTTGENIVRATFTGVDESKKGQGLFTAAIVDPGQYYVNGADMTPLNVYNIIGITAADDDFIQWESILTHCLSTLKYTDKFVSDTTEKIASDTKAAMAANATIQSAYDSYNNAWSARQTTYDAISQKNSDATLGYDRVYDSETGETYKAELGWYDQYNPNREEFSNPNLYLVTDDNMYNQGISGYIEKPVK